MKKDYELLLKTKYSNRYNISNENTFYQYLIKDKYELLEWFILNNKLDLVQFSIELLLKKENKSFLMIFKPGFFRNPKILKRQLANYLLIQSSKEMQKLLLFYSDIRNISLFYNNDIFI